MDRNRLSVSSDSLFKELAFTPAKLLILTPKLFTVNTLINSIALFFVINYFYPQVVVF